MGLWESQRGTKTFPPTLRKKIPLAWSAGLLHLSRGSCMTLGWSLGFSVLSTSLNRFAHVSLQLHPWAKVRPTSRRGTDQGNGGQLLGSVLGQLPIPAFWKTAFSSW